MRAGASAILLCAVALMAGACDLDNAGDEPPRGLVYFPNALALSKNFLFVANSNFDLRYKAGSLQAYSLKELATLVDACRDEKACVIDPLDALADEVMIGSHATSLAVSPDERQAFVTTNTDTTLATVHLEVAGDALTMSCGDGSSRCDSNTEREVDRHTDGDSLDYVERPISVISGSLSDFAQGGADVEGNYALVSHRSGDVSLYMERSDSTFALVGAIDGLEPGLTQAVYDPATKLAHIAVARGSSGRLIVRVGVSLFEDDEEVLQASLFNAGTLLVEGTSHVAETHDLVVSPMGMLLVSQAPSALLAVELPEADDSAANRARVTDIVVVGGGASRAATGTVGGRVLAVVACFDAREIFVIDLINMQARSVVPNLSGPFELALDQERGLLYAADFKSSVIRVIDLGPLVTGNGDGTAEVIATLGAPRVLQELR